MFFLVPKAELVFFFSMWGDGNGNSMEMTLWSDMPRSYTSRLLIGAESVMTRSRVCPWCGYINMLSEIKIVQKLKKFSSKTAGGGFQVDVHVSQYNCISRWSTERWEEVVHLQNESWVRFGWTVDKYSHEERRPTFKCKALKRGQFR